jgi:hypothetical protein
MKVAKSGRSIRPIHTSEKLGVMLEVIKSGCVFESKARGTWGVG